MDRGWWSEAVPVWIDNRTRLNVNNTMQAARVLLEDWPVEPGSKHLAAQRAVMAALGNLAEAKGNAKARSAFVAAAREADILVK